MIGRTSTSTALACCALTLLLGSGCCQEEACQDGVTVFGELDVSVDEPLRVAIDACRDDACSSGVLDSNAIQPPGNQITVDLVGSASVTCLAHTASPTFWQFGCTFLPDDGAGDLEDGDVVIVRIVNAYDAVELVDFQQSVDYDVVEIGGGAHCGACDFAHIEVLSSGGAGG